MRKIYAIGLNCPEPLMKLRHELLGIPCGEIIEFYSDDPVSLRDIPAFCSFSGHDLIALPDPDHPHRFVIKAGEGKKS